MQTKYGTKLMALERKVGGGLYLISPEIIQDIEKFCLDLSFILTGGVRVSFFQLRLKNISTTDLIFFINKIRPICIKHGTIFVLNDNAELAIELKCDALHIGKSDGKLGDIRSKFEGIIGVSCYNDPVRAANMINEGADYISFGAFYKSTTKPDAVNCPLSVLKNFRKDNPSFPICAIGGINSSNSKVLIDAGATLIAFSSAIWNLNNNAQRVEQININSHQSHLSFY